MGEEYRSQPSLQSSSGPAMPAGTTADHRRQPPDADRRLQYYLGSHAGKAPVTGPANGVTVTMDFIPIGN